MAATILCFGDSNTYGTPPITVRGVVARHDADVRWPDRLAVLTGATVIAEGLPGRTAGALSDPEMGAHMNGQLGLRIALQSHGPIDRLVIMLGTNDLKTHFGLDAQGIAGGVAGLLAIAQSEEMQSRHGGYRTLLICPPPVQEVGPIAHVFLGAAAKAAALPPHYAALARVWGADFLDAGTAIATSPRDGVHFAPDDHLTLAVAVAAALAI